MSKWTKELYNLPKSARYGNRFEWNKEIDDVIREGWEMSVHRDKLRKFINNTFGLNISESTLLRRYRHLKSLQEKEESITFKKRKD